MTCSSKYMYILYYANLQFKLEFYNSCSLIFFQQDRDFKKAHMHTVALVFYTFYPIQKFSIFRNTQLSYTYLHIPCFLKTNISLSFLFLLFLPQRRSSWWGILLTSQRNQTRNEQNKETVWIYFLILINLKGELTYLFQVLNFKPW